MTNLKIFFKVGVSLKELRSDYGDPTFDDYFMGGRLVVFDEKNGYFLTKENTVSGFTTGD